MDPAGGEDDPGSAAPPGGAGNPAPIVQESASVPATGGAGEAAIAIDVKADVSPIDEKAAESANDEKADASAIDEKGVVSARGETGDVGASPRIDAVAEAAADASPDPVAPGTEHPDGFGDTEAEAVTLKLAAEAGHGAPMPATDGAGEAVSANDETGDASATPRVDQADHGAPIPATDGVGEALSADDERGDASASPRVDAAAEAAAHSSPDPIALGTERPDGLGDTEVKSPGGLTVQHVSLPDTEVAVATQGDDGDLQKKVEALSQNLQMAMQKLVTEFDSGLTSLPDGQLRDAFTDWKDDLQSHMNKLTGLTAAQDGPDSDERAAEIMEELDRVKDVRIELQAAREGREVEHVASEWADPEDTEREVQELQRMRNQIRCIFGGMVDNISPRGGRGDIRLEELFDAEMPTPAAAHLRSDDRVVPAIPQFQPAARAHRSRSSGRHRGERSQPNHRGGQAEVASLSSSNTTWDSHTPHESSRPDDEDRDRRRDRQDDEDRERRRERKERKHRKKSADTKKDDGAAPKKWNWAEEVVKASLDPQNQWEFPAEARPSPGHGLPPAPPSWQMPRRPGGSGGSGSSRGEAVAIKVRQRAEEVARQESDRERERGRGESDRERYRGHGHEDRRRYR